MMTYYKDLIEKIRFEFGTLYDEDDYQAELYGEAADAIEELSEKLKKERAKVRHLKNVVAKMKNEQHYSGRYIKSIMGVEE